MKLMQRNRRSQQGQTLIIALLILGVLLILGAVFAGILSRTIKGTQLSKTRGQSNDFAESGVRYAHSQLVNSELGADWRGQPEVIVETAVNFTRDPDIYYLRPASPVFLTPGTNRADKGGPDGLGPYFRVLYRGGRALIRVKYLKIVGGNLLPTERHARKTTRTLAGSRSRTKLEPGCA